MGPARRDGVGDRMPRRLATKLANPEVPDVDVLEPEPVADGVNIPEMSASDAARDARSSEDQQLVLRAQKGDAHAFEQLVVQYQRKVYAVAFGMVRNRQDALDITQEAFIKVHRYLGNFQGSSSFYTWLYRIVVNLSIDHLRKGGKGPPLDYDDRVRRDESNTAGDPSILPSILGSNPGKALARKELLEQMQIALDALPPYHRAVIVMRELEGMSYKEMAKAMHVSKGTIMSRLHHARHKLQKLLEEYLKGDTKVD
jgi:RNA polymerase sigma-70 factor, ECF subfamily